MTPSCEAPLLCVWEACNGLLPVYNGTRVLLRNVYAAKGDLILGQPWEEIG